MLRSGAALGGDEMPKFLHAADLHIDSPLYGLDAYESAPVERLRRATREATRNLVKLALAEQVAFVVLAGDVYDTNPDLKSALFFREQLQRLADANIGVVIALGNHDHAGVAPHNLSVPKGVTVLPSDQADGVSPAAGVVVHGRSYPRPDCRDDLASKYPKPSEHELNIGLLHTVLQDTQHQPYAPTSPQALAAHGYQYWALGHVHRFGRFDLDGVPIVFPGNIQGRHARETGAKGAVLVTYERARVVSVERRLVDVMRWHHVEVDVTDAGPEIVPFVKRAILDATATDRGERRLCAVRVTVSGARPLRARAVDAQDLRDALMGELQELGGDLWLEKVRVETTTRREDATEIEQQLASLARELAPDEVSRKELAILVDEVRAQLRETDRRLTEPDATSGERIESLVGEARTMSEADAEALLARAASMIQRGLS